MMKIRMMTIMRVIMMISVIMIGQEYIKVDPVQRSERKKFLKRANRIKKFLKKGKKEKKRFKKRAKRIKRF